MVWVSESSTYWYCPQVGALLNIRIYTFWESNTPDPTLISRGYTMHKDTSQFC